MVGRGISAVDADNDVYDGLLHYPKIQKTPNSIFLTKLCAGWPEFRAGETRRTSVMMSVGVSVSLCKSLFWLGNVIFLRLSVFASFYIYNRTHTLTPLASCASGGMM